MAKLTVVKVGGGVLENNSEMNRFIDEFCKIDGLKVLVHGGGRLATSFMERMGIPVNIVDGRRITDAQTLYIVTMTYGGLVNKQTVAALLARGVNAVGVTGVDAGLVIANKRPVREIDYGFVGDVKSVNTTLLNILLNSNMVPVIAPLSTDGNGLILNTNADTIAAEVAIALSSLFDTTLIYCFEKAGVLSDPSNNASIIRTITPSSFALLKNNRTVTDGMIPKLENCFDALSRGVTQVRITNTHGLGSEKGTTLTI